MNILHIIPSLSKGGAERLSLDICIESQKRQELDVRIVVLSEKNEYKELSKEINYKICHANVTPSIFGKPIVVIKELNKIIKDFKPQIIHSHLFEAEIVSRWQLFPDIKYISHCHDNMVQFKNFSHTTFLKKERLTMFFEKQLLIKRYKKCNNHFITISKDSDNYFNRVLPSSLKKNIHLSPNGIDFTRFYHPQKSIRKLQTTNNINIINVGSLVDKKNQTFLVEVINYLHKRNFQTKLTFLGEGVNRKLIQQKINAYNLTDFVSLKGNVSNVEDILFESDIYVHSATYEPFGLALLEAMASGLPVVCLDGKGNRDIIEEGKNGFMIYKKDPKLFAEKIIELIENPQLYRQMSAYCVEFARKYDIKEYVDKLIELYKEVLNN